MDTITKHTSLRVDVGDLTRADRLAAAGEIPASRAQVLRQAITVGLAEIERRLAAADANLARYGLTQADLARLAEEDRP